MANGIGGLFSGGLLGNMAGMPPEVAQMARQRMMMALGAGMLQGNAQGGGFGAALGAGGMAGLQELDAATAQGMQAEAQRRELEMREQAGSRDERQLSALLDQDKFERQMKLKEAELAQKSFDREGNVINREMANEDRTRQAQLQAMQALAGNNPNAGAIGQLGADNPALAAELLMRQRGGIERIQGPGGAQMLGQRDPFGGIDPLGTFSGPPQQETTVTRVPGIGGGGQGMLNRDALMAEIAREAEAMGGRGQPQQGLGRNALNAADQGFNRAAEAAGNFARQQAPQIRQEAPQVRQDLETMERGFNRAAEATGNAVRQGVGKLFNRGGEQPSAGGSGKDVFQRIPQLQQMNRSQLSQWMATNGGSLSPEEKQRVSQMLAQMGG